MFSIMFGRPHGYNYRSHCERPGRRKSLIGTSVPCIDDSGRLEFFRTDAGMVN